VSTRTRPAAGRRPTQKRRPPRNQSGATTRETKTAFKRTSNAPGRRGSVHFVNGSNTSPGYLPALGGQGSNLQQPAPKASPVRPPCVVQCADLRLLGQVVHGVRSGSSNAPETDSYVSTCRPPDQAGNGDGLSGGNVGKVGSASRLPPTPDRLT